jgi:hypothetical protein
MLDGRRYFRRMTHSQAYGSGDRRRSGGGRRPFSRPTEPFFRSRQSHSLSVKHVPLQYGVVLRENRDDHRGILRPLALVDGPDEDVVLAGSINHGVSVEVATSSPTSGSTSSM